MTVDTNVLLHAQNPKEQRASDSQRFLERLKRSHTLLCVDLGFDVDETRNRSRVGAEYLRFIRFGSIGYAVLTYLLQQRRVSEVNLKVRPEISKKINQLVADKLDRVFVRIGINSADSVLVSHDFKDFRPKVRKELKAAFGVRIIDGAEGSRLLV